MYASKAADPDTPVLRYIFPTINICRSAWVLLAAQSRALTYNERRTQRCTIPSAHYLLSTTLSKPPMEVILETLEAAYYDDRLEPYGRHLANCALVNGASDTSLRSETVCKSLARAVDRKAA